MEKLAHKVSDRAAVPWYGQRFELIAWMEILEFSALNYIAIVRTLARVSEMFDRLKDIHITPDSTKEVMRETTLPNIRGHCIAIGLTLSVKAVDRFSEKVSESYTLPLTDFKTSLLELNQRIEDEIEDNLFLFVPKTHVVWYKAEHLFGSEVEQSFPSTTYDIKEAGKCLALHRNTASVCHLMRVLEIGLRALAVKFNVSYENKPWNYIIEVAENRLKRIRVAKRKPRNWKVDEKFYSEAIAHFRFLKDAWRNYSMHVFERYDENQSESIFNHTKAFMRHLATKLKEAP